ncbi:MAG TPA: metallophosphoesterase [Tepidisphaeraceae bacterium]|nr:metallophosphoesterase [Tepidisphaeraceae bacterium]
MPLRLLVTADLHYNHPRSVPLADGVIGRMNAAGGDVLLVVGDTAVADGDALEQCLSKFAFAGPKLFVAGNHELWTRRGDSLGLFEEELPRRVRALGWHWLETEPFVAGDVAIVGSVGWYDFSFAQPSLGIPTRFYAAKLSPGAAIRLAPSFDHLRPEADDVPPHAREVVARWNDGKFVHLGRTDEVFLRERVAQLAMSLEQVWSARQVVAAVHHLPFCELLPPPHSAQWDFAKAYLGSAALGAALLAAPNVTHCFCGHSHFPTEATVGQVRAVNVGSGYRWKTFHSVDVG